MRGKGGDGGAVINVSIGLPSPPSGNNRIPELREAQRLRELPKLIILDLSGNPCTSGGIGGRTSASAVGTGPVSAGAATAAAAAAGDDYRLYVVYNVRKLKVGPLERGEYTNAISRPSPDAVEASVYALALSKSLPSRLRLPSPHPPGA